MQSRTHTGLILAASASASGNVDTSSERCFWSLDTVVGWSLVCSLPLFSVAQWYDTGVCCRAVENAWVLLCTELSVKLSQRTASARVQVSVGPRTKCSVDEGCATGKLRTYEVHSGKRMLSLLSAVVILVTARFR